MTSGHRKAKDLNGTFCTAGCWMSWERAPPCRTPSSWQMTCSDRCCLLSSLTHKWTLHMHLEWGKTSKFVLHILVVGCDSPTGLRRVPSGLQM